MAFDHISYKNFLALKAHGKDKFVTSVSAALAAGMAGYLVQGLTDNVWYNYRIVAYFWMIIAISGIILNLREEAKQ